MKKLEYILCFLMVSGFTAGLFAQNAPVSTLGTISTSSATAVVPVTVNGFTDISACNLKVAYDVDIAILTGVTIGPDVNPSGNINVNTSVPGEVKIGWFGSVKATLPNGGIAFNLHFTRVGEGTSTLTFVDDDLSRSCQYYLLGSDLSNVLLNDSPTATYYKNGSLTFRPATTAPLTTIPMREACIGETVSFPVVVKEFINIGAVSMEISYNPAVLTNPVFANTSNAIPLSYLNPSPGIIRVSGFTSVANGSTLADNAVLFTLSFSYLGGSSALSFVHTSETTCQYSGPTPTYTERFDSPKPDFWKNGGVQCKGVPVITSTSQSRDLGFNPVVQAPVFTGTDACDGPFTPVVTTSGPQNTGCAYTQTWNANFTSKCGATAQTVSVVYTWTIDTQAPVATQGTIGACYPTAEAARTAAIAATTALSDNCTAPADLIVTAEATGTCSATVTVTVKDKAGNSSVYTYNTRIDNAAPLLTCVANPVIKIVTAAENGYTTVGTEFNPAVSDNCPGAITISHNMIHTSSTSLAGYKFPVGTTTVTWIASDVCGRTATCSLQVQVQVSAAAPITAIPTLEACVGETVSFPVTVRNYNNIGEAHLELAYNPAILTNPVLVSYSNVLPLALTTPSSGTVRISGKTTAIGGGTLPNDAVLFTISFTYLGGVSDLAFVHTSATPSRYGGPAPGYLTFADTPKSLFYINGGVRCKDILPVITTTAQSRDIGFNPVVQPPVFTGTDPCDGTFVPVVTTLGPQSTGCSFTQTWNANYTSRCGVKAQQLSVTYTWTVDNQPPSATKGTIAACFPTDEAAKAAAITATTGLADNCAAVADLLVTAAVSGSCSAVVTVSVKDKAGNTKEIVYNTRIDNTAPQLACVASPAVKPFSSTLNGYRASGNELDPVVSDNCPGTLTYSHNLTHNSSTTLAGYLFPRGTTTVTWTASDACGNTATCTLDVIVSTPAVQVSVTANPLQYNAIGQVIVFSAQVTNTGGSSLINVVVNDLLTGRNETIPLLLPLQSGPISFSYPVTKADLDRGFLTNRITATGSDPVNQVVTGEATVTVNAIQTGKINVVKTASQSTYVLGDKITYSVSVENSGNVTLSGVTVTDPMLPGIAYTGGDTNTDSKLEVGEKWTYQGVHTITQANMDAGTLKNTATVKARYGDMEVTGNAEVTVTTTRDAKMSVLKTLTGVNGIASAANYSIVGDVLAYKIEVKNTGNVTLSTINVTDPLTAGSWNIPTLPPGQTQTFTTTYTAVKADVDSKSITNKAIAAGKDPAGAAISAESAVTTSGNAMPVATDDVYDTEMNIPVTGNVRDNDFDPDNDPLTVNITPVLSPSNGTVSIAANGQFTYTPRIGFVGTDYFEYRICDQPGLCDVGRVTLNVAGCEIFIPNGFSPNNDGINDYFEMLCFQGKYTDVKIEIYNRWGHIVYQKEDYGNLDRWGSDAWWDGRSNRGLAIGNEILPTGTYFYVLFLNNGNEPVTGAIFLNR
jgi:gliding motility-associated-like protein/uncharacterized repeat protein (TIGR01451 family)